MASVDLKLFHLNKLRDLALHMILPVTALVSPLCRCSFVMLRAAVADVRNAPFLLAAVGAWHPETHTLVSLCASGGGESLISLFGFSIGALLSGSLLIEVVMSWPGLGPCYWRPSWRAICTSHRRSSCSRRFFLVGGNLLADLLLYWADPRIRTRVAHDEHAAYVREMARRTLACCMGLWSAPVFSRLRSRRAGRNSPYLPPSGFISWMPTAKSTCGPFAYSVRLREGSFDQYEEDTTEPQPVKFS